MPRREADKDRDGYQDSEGGREGGLPQDAVVQADLAPHGVRGQRKTNLPTVDQREGARPLSGQSPVGVREALPTPLRGTALIRSQRRGRPRSRNPQSHEAAQDKSPRADYCEIARRRRSWLWARGESGMRSRTRPGSMVMVRRHSTHTGVSPGPHDTPTWIGGSDPGQGWKWDGSRATARLPGDRGGHHGIRNNESVHE